MITGARDNGGWWWLLDSLHFRLFVCLLITICFLLLEHFLHTRPTKIFNTHHSIASMVLCKNKVRPESVDLPASRTIQKSKASVRPRAGPTCRCQKLHPSAVPLQVGSDPASKANFDQAPERLKLRQHLPTLHLIPKRIRTSWHYCSTTYQKYWYWTLTSRTRSLTLLPHWLVTAWAQNHQVCTKRFNFALYTGRRNLGERGMEVRTCTNIQRAIHRPFPYHAI